MTFACRATEREREDGGALNICPGDENKRRFRLERGVKMRLM